jgi:preprotein translocase subunit SecD
VLEEAVRIIERRLRASGIANGTVVQQRDKVVIELPEAKDDLAVLAFVSETAQLFFRPVDCEVPGYRPASRKKSSASKAVEPLPALALAARTTTVPVTMATTTSPVTAVCGLTSAHQEAYSPPHGNAQGDTPAQYDVAGATVVLPSYGTNLFRYVLGPAQMTGSIVRTAAANLDTSNDEWEVDLTFTGAGSVQFNDYASDYYKCYQEDTSNPPDAEQCPPYGSQQAIELDATVESAPSIEAPSFPGGATISGSGSNPFTAKQAGELAVALNYGALPVRFVSQEITTVG